VQPPNQCGRTKATISHIQPPNRQPKLSLISLAQFGRGILGHSSLCQTEQKDGEGRKYAHEATLRQKHFGTEI
jgi:hypothetical protein